MAIRENIAAHTASGMMPSYISINLRDDEQISVIVRGDSSVGSPCAEILMPKEVLIELARQSLYKLNAK